MFPFHTVEYLHSLDIDRERDLRDRQQLRVAHAARSAAREATQRPGAAAGSPYAGPERRRMPCPELTQATTR